MKLVTSTQMRALEQTAVDAGTSLDDLMEAAGLAVAQEVWLMLGVVAGRRVLVLCGPGNNGSDGLVAARHLREWEADVAVYMLGVRDDADANLAKVRALDVPIFVASEDADFDRLDEALAGAEIIIDALLGTGRSRAIDSPLADILRRLDATRSANAPPRIIAVDLPTGVDADSGNADARAVRADMTVTFGLAKVGLYTLPGSEHAGRVQVVDIGLPKDAEREVPVDLLSTPWVRERLPARPKDGNKGTFGRVLVVAGSAQYPGTAQLAAEACYRVGAGLVALAATPRLQSIVAPSLPEATYLVLDESPSLTPDAALRIGDALAQYAVMLIGPGLGQSDRVAASVFSVLSAAPDSIGACVIDADALNGLATTATWHERLKRPAVLTPHPGEMARLLGCSVADVQADRLNIAMKAAEDWGHVVVLKGAHTIVAAPDGRAAISPYANPLLATAGTGDVLAGTIGGLLAQGMQPFEAAACGVFVHGLAAEEVGEEIGDRGLLASDLLPALPRAIRTVRGGKRMAAAPSTFGGMMDLSALGGVGVEG